MKKLSTGDDSTLGTYRRMAVALFGEESKAVAFIDKKIRQSPGGSDEEVLADEGQMLYTLCRMDTFTTKVG